MRPRFVALLFFVGTLTTAGCGGSPLPSADQVTKIRLSVRTFPGNAAWVPCTVNLTDKADIDRVMDWLATIDWSQSGTDMKVIQIQEADGGITVETKAGEPQDFGFYWDGKFTLAKANRLIRGGDVEKLKKLVQRFCK